MLLMTWEILSKNRKIWDFLELEQASIRKDKDRLLIMKENS